MIVLVAPISGRLADRIGSRPLMATGLTLASIALFMQTRIDVGTGYGLLLPSFMIMGIGMAMTISPMSTAAMNAVTEDKAGVASGILSMSRMLGGTFGVAAIGALFQHLASNRLAETLAGTGLTAAQRDDIVHNLGSGKQGDLSGLDPHTAHQVADAGRDAFIHALSRGMWLSSGVAFLGAMIALALIRRREAEMPDAARAPQAAAEAEAIGV
jgi:MFS family permease